MTVQTTLFEAMGAKTAGRNLPGQWGKPRESFLTGLLAAWLALDRAGEGAKPTKGEREAARLAAREALDALRRPTAPGCDPG